MLHWICALFCLYELLMSFWSSCFRKCLYLIVPFCYASAAYQASLVEPWFVFWRDAVEPKYPWRDQTSVIERFSFECRKVIGFAFTTLRDWFKKLVPLFHPIRSKTNTNHDSLVRVFPRFASATCNYFVFWLVHLIVCVICDWLEWLLWFWFYDTQLKTALCRRSVPQRYD